MEEVPWMESPSVLFADGGMTRLIPRAEDGPARRLNKRTRATLLLTMLAYFMKPDGKFVFLGAVTVAGLLATYSPPVDIAARNAAAAEKQKAADRQAAIEREQRRFVETSTTNTREAAGWGQVVPSDDEKVYQQGRPVLPDPGQEFDTLFHEQTAGGMKFVSGRKY